MWRGCSLSQSAAGLACTTALQAAMAGTPAPDGQEREILDIEPAVRTAVRLIQPVSEAPVTMTILDRATIEASGFRSLPDVLRLVPGMYVRPGIGLEGTVPVVSYHGLSNEYARRMQVLVDGRSVYLPPFSTVLWDDLPLAIDDVDHIEITRGPNAASDGANAFFGTINIITRTPVAGEGPYGLVRGGSNGIRDLVVRDTGANGRLNVRFTAGYREDGGYDRLFDRQRHDYVTGRADFDFDAGDSLQAQIGQGEGWRGFGIIGDPVDGPRNADLADAYAQLKWQHTRAPDDEFSIQYYYQRHSSKESSQPPLSGPNPPPIGAPGGPNPSYVFSKVDEWFDRHDVEIVRTMEPFDQVRAVLGCGARLDEVKAPVFFGDRPYVASNLERLFFHLEWRVKPALLLQGGAMLERTSIDGFEISPRMSATYHLDPHQTLHAGVSRAGRTPSLFEKQGDFEQTHAGLRSPVDLAGADIRPEHLIDSEIGYHLSPREGNLQLDVKAYRDMASKLIGATTDPLTQGFFGPVHYSKNLGSARVTGIELEVHYQPGPVTRYLLSYANTLISTDVPVFQRTMPRNVLSGLAQRRFNAGWIAGLSVYMTSGLSAKAATFGQSGESAVGYQRRFDVHFGRQMRLLGAKATVTVGVQDLNSDFVEFSPTTTFERRWYVEFSAGR
jgi:iron complex outermembrane receptor protein